MTKAKAKTKKEIEAENKSLRSQLASLQSCGDCVLCPVRKACLDTLDGLRKILAPAIELEAEWRRTKPHLVSVLDGAEMAMSGWTPSVVRYPQVAESA